MNMLYASLNMNVKLVWNLQRATHTDFISSILAPGFLHLRVYLMTCFLFLDILSFFVGESQPRSSSDGKIIST